MTTLQLLTIHLSTTTIMATATLSLWRKMPHTSWRGAALLCLFMVSFLPVNGLPVAGYIRGVLGELSLCSVVLLTLYLHRQLHQTRQQPIMPASAWAIIAVLGLVYYPLSLGLGMVDPYQWGFQPVLLVLFILLVASILWLRNQSALALALLLALFGYQLTALESENLWDYLLDPWLVAYAVSVLVHRGLTWFKKSRQ